MDAGLRVRGVSKRFGATQALAAIDFDVAPGEVVALLGENGAGKSTLASIVAGVIAPDGGTMSWQGKPYAPRSPRDAQQAGIGLIHQEIRLLPDLTVAENVFLGRWPARRGWVDRAQMDRMATEQLHRLGLDIAPGRLVRGLPVAVQQQIEIAKALSSNASLLILDEPTAALGAEETEHLFERIASLRREGVSFVYVSHRLEEIARIADRIVTLRDGRWVASHTSGKVPIAQLVEEMVGRSLERIFPALSPPREREVLRAASLTAKGGAFHDVSFEVREGEVLGIAGIVGAGRTELTRVLAGADPAASGDVWLDGRRFDLRGPREAIDAGIVLVPEDRKTQGLLLDASIGENVVLGNLDRVARNTWKNWIGIGRARDFALAAVGPFRVKGSVDQPVRTLSGGNQQKVVMAKWLARRPRVVLLDEPTRGIDIGARAAIYEVVADLARAGVAVVLVSSELDEVLGLSHRVLVLSRGRQVGLLDRLQASRATVMRLATIGSA